MQYFVRCSCSYALQFVEGYTTPEREGVALWLLPGKTKMTIGRMYRAGMLSAPFKMGFEAFGRFLGFTQHTDQIHQKVAPIPHDTYSCWVSVQQRKEKVLEGSCFPICWVELIKKKCQPTWKHRKFGTSSFTKGMGL